MFSLSLSISCDASQSAGVARFINHASAGQKSNLRPRVVDGSPPTIALFAVRDIAEGEELAYPYGEWRRDVVAANEWLKL